MSKSIANIEVDEDKFNSTNETPNLHLPQFIATDKPGWLTDFNGSMEVIDEAAKVLQDQVTEQFEDLESVHTQLDRVDDEINNPETGLKQVLSDTQTRVTDLETTVGDENHGLVKDVNVLKSDMIETNTMAVDSHAKVASLINLICAKYSTAVQYNEGAYVYTENEDGSLNFLRCTDTTRGAFNPAKWEDVTEKLITALDNSGGGSGSQYVLPIAGDADDPDAVLGGVIIGEGLSIDENGVLSRTVEPSEGIGPDYYATALRAGLVKPSDGLQVGLNGALSVVVDDSTIKIENGQLVATPDTSRFAAGQGIDITNESTPSISCKVDGTTIGFTSDGKLKAIFPASSYELTAGLGISIEVDPEAQTPTKVVSSDLATPNNFGAVMPKSPDFVFESYDQQHPERKKLAVQLVQNGGLVKRGSGEGNASGLAVNVDNETVTINSQGQLVAQGGGGGGTPYVLPPATQSTLGGIKVGSGLSVEEDGTLSATGGGSGTSLFDSIGAGLRVRNEETMVITAVPSLETGEVYGYTFPDEPEFYVNVIGTEITTGTYDPNAVYFKGSEDADPSDSSAWTPVTVTAETTGINRILEALIMNSNPVTTNQGIIRSIDKYDGYGGVLRKYDYSEFSPLIKGLGIRVLPQLFKHRAADTTYFNPFGNNRYSYRDGNSIIYNFPDWDITVTIDTTTTPATVTTSGTTFNQGEIVAVIEGMLSPDIAASGTFINSVFHSTTLAFYRVSNTGINVESYFNFTYTDGNLVITPKAPTLRYSGISKFDGPLNDLTLGSYKSHLLRRKMNSTDTLLLPFKNILATGDITTGDLMPVASSINDNVVNIGNHKQVPLAFLYPLYFEIADYDEDNVPANYQLYNKDYSGKLITITYSIELVKSGMTTVIDEKKITLGSGHMNSHKTGVVPVIDKIAHLAGGQGNDGYGYMYGIAFIPPCDADFIRVDLQLELVDLSEGTVERYFNRVFTSSGVEHESWTGPLTPHGSTYLYDLSTETYTDSDILG